MRRSDQRRDAVFALYQHEVTDRDLDELLNGDGDAKPFTRELAEGVREHATSSTRRSRRSRAGWALERIAPLERSIMRVALFEMRHRDDIPDEVAIDEAVSFAKEYCGADAPGLRQRHPRRCGQGAGMNEEAGDGEGRAGIERTRDRLREIAERLRAPDLGDDEAEKLAREAADLAGEASAAVERALAEPGDDGS